jgi:hypothetical protein
MRPVSAGLVAITLALCGPPAVAEAPGGSDLELVTRARTALGDLRAFERLNDEVVRRCHEPVKGAYADWREEFQADLERAHALEKQLRLRVGGDAQQPPIDDQLRPFMEVDGQALFSRCLRWSTLLIQHESRIRADAAAPLGFLRDNEARLRAILGNDAAWREWRAAGTLP